MRVSLIHAASGGVVALLAATAAPSAFAVEYMTAEQAARTMFPDAEAFVPETVALDAAQLGKLDAQGIRGRSARWQALAARRGGQTLGWVVADQVLGKVELIGYAVGIGADGSVRQIEILSYRESHGFEIRLPAWRRQFIGKTTASAIEVGDDIANISGATLSCNHVTEGVKRIVAVVALARQSGALA